MQFTTICIYNQQQAVSLVIVPNVDKDALRGSKKECLCAIISASAVVCFWKVIIATSVNLSYEIVFLDRWKLVPLSVLVPLASSKVIYL